MLNRIAEVASNRKPILVLFNQMGRFLGWAKSSADATRRCEEHRSIICNQALQNHGACGSVTVFLTEFTEYAAMYDDVQWKGVKSVEEVGSFKPPVQYAAETTAIVTFAALLCTLLCPNGLSYSSKGNHFAHTSHSSGRFQHQLCMYCRCGTGSARLDVSVGLMFLTTHWIWRIWAGFWVE